MRDPKIQGTPQKIRPCGIFVWKIFVREPAASRLPSAFRGRTWGGPKARLAQVKRLNGREAPTPVELYSNARGAPVSAAP